MKNDLARIQEELTDLISLELAGELDSRSKMRLDDYIRLYGLEAIDRRRIIQRLKEKKEFDYTDAYKKFLYHTSLQRVDRNIQRLKKILAYAALISLFVGIGWLWNHERTKKRFPAIGLHASTTPIIPGRSRAVITLSNGKKLNSGKESNPLHYENGSVLTFDTAQAIYTATAKTERPVFNTITIPPGGEYQLILADGTIVWLNAVTVLTFQVSFPNGKREVFLEGEAYFEVAKDKEHPFLVHTSRGEIEVLGTGFNVRDYREEGKVVTTLAEGRILYRPENDPEHEIMLQPGYQVEDKEGSRPVSRQVDVVMYSGWKDGIYIFENTTLEEIMEVLSRWYNIEVFYTNEAAKGLHFTGDLERYNTINDFLEFIEIGGNVRFSVKGRTIIIE